MCSFEILTYLCSYTLVSTHGMVEGKADDPYPQNGHLTQVLWRASTWVGCADASNGNTHIQVCQYARPANCDKSNYGTWIGPILLPQVSVVPNAIPMNVA